MTECARIQTAVLVLCNALILAVSSPVYMPQFLPGGVGRNIRHLPCVSRRTGETGVCMFAFTCAKANGTHLGTCIDRFYFGSCCKIDGEPDIFPHDNTIDDGGPVKPDFSNHGSIESNNIPDYSPDPTQKSTLNPPKASIRTTEAPVKTTQIPVTIQKPVTASQKPVAATTRAPVSKPVKTTVSSTNKYTLSPVPESTTDFVGLSTFQTVENIPPKTSTTPRPTSRPTTKYPVRISTTAPATNTKPRPTVNKPTSTVKPYQKPVTQNNTKIEAKPTNKPTSKPSVNKPTSVKPSVTGNTVQSGGLTTNKIRFTTPKPIGTTTTRPTISATRFPPRNATTTTTTTPRPKRPNPNRRPTTTTTKKPTSTPVKRITTTSTTPTTPVHGRPSQGSVTVSSKPSTVAGIKNVTTQVGGSSPTKVPVTETVSHGGHRPTSSGQRPSVTGNKPSVTVSLVTKHTTVRPTTSFTKPITPPTAPSVAEESSKPTTTTEKPLLTRPKPVTPQVQESLTAMTPLKRPTTPASTIVTTTESVVTRKPVLSSSYATPTPPTSPSPSTSSISNEVIFPDETTNQIPVSDVDKVESTSYSPGLVTWTSNSDDVTTKAPVVAISTSEEPTNTEWTPITTPDGWILVQSPSPNEPDKNEDNPTITPTTQSLVSDKPITPSTSTTERSTARPSLPTVATTDSTGDEYVPTAELNMSDYKQVCGRRLFPESRIVGGSRSAFGKWPWQISLRQWRTSTYLHKCGAALLNENWAITAAHCVENVPPSDLLLRLGEHDLASEEEPYGFQERRVQIVASHPQFDPRTFEYDLALLRFYEPLLPFQPNTLPICLPDDDANYVGLTAHVTGWGRLYEDGPLPSVLQEVPVPVINNTVCESMYRSAGYIEHIPKIFICAGWRKGGFDSCEGDSGGPLVIQRPRDKRWILAGIISWGIGCAEPNQPGVYTRISEFREWINQILQF